MTRQTRVLIGVTVAGVILLTTGVIMLVAGTAMGLASHRGWAAITEAGVILALAGLACGVALIAVTAAWRRERRGRAAAGPWAREDADLAPMGPPRPQPPAPPGPPAAQAPPEPRLFHPSGERG